MKTTDIDFIKQIADLMDEKALAELSIEDGDQKIALKKHVSTNSNVAAVAPQEEVAIKEEQPVAQSKKLTPITSPMVGTFYSSSSPDKNPFVSVGDMIRPGQVVCIIEAMKLMNEIESDISGKVIEICVENGQTIEFGQVLMYIE